MQIRAWTSSTTDRILMDVGKLVLSISFTISAKYCIRGNRSCVNTVFWTRMGIPSCTILQFINTLNAVLYPNAYPSGDILNSRHQPVGFVPYPLDTHDPLHILVSSSSLPPILSLLWAAKTYIRLQWTLCAYTFVTQTLLLLPCLRILVQYF